MPRQPGEASHAAGDAVLAVDLSEDYVVGGADGIWTATHDGEFRELSITSLSAPAEAPLDKLLETLADVHRHTLRDGAGATSMTPLEVVAPQGITPLLVDVD